MPRSKIKYQFIEDERARNVTMKKRNASLIKKMSELKTLCGVESCLVLYEKEDAPPTVWPSNAEAERLIQKFDESPLTMGNANARQDHPDIMKKTIAKVKKQMDKEKEKYLKNLMVKCLFDDNAIGEINNVEELDAVRSMILSEIEVINDLIEERKASNNVASSSAGASSSNQTGLKNFI
ncbi:agamous-like MADS-box protein AGL80 [Bidens hawaiensis]|uniref:agamous-like MADS-box protein AGL80 n=1 Tax=Bidens hawaiensis TaxID=980011 RepID=UPI004049711D